MLGLLAASGCVCVAQDAPAAAAAAAKAGKPQVLFQRSDDTGSRALDAEQRATKPAGRDSVPVAVTDAMRLAPVFTAYDLEVHLVAGAGRDSGLSVEARLTIRNGGAEPLAALPLQLSSSLHVERVSLDGAALALSQRPLASDADHTGKLEETLVTLPRPLAPGASVTIVVAYSGTVAASSERLDQLQTPAEIAASSDWDAIGEEFTGLRGFGDVVWYPVCSAPASLGDGVKLFAEIGRQRAVNQDATIAMRVTDEFTGAAPDVAVLAGHVIDPGRPLSMPNGAFAGVLRMELPATRLGFRTPSLFVASRSVTGGAADALRVYSTAAHAVDAEGYLTAAKLVEPLESQWLGVRVAQQLAVLDLPVEGAQPSEQGGAVLVSLVAAEPQQIAPLLAQELAHTRFHSPRVWLDEGVPALLGLLYREQTEGRTAALEQLAGSRTALAFIEPASPGAGAGEDLLHAQDAIYYRAKAEYVLWMLRDVAGDKALSAALRAYDASADTRPEYFEQLVERASGRDLRWFFDAWVYRDLGLPDLAIVNVFYSRTSGAAALPDQWLVSVDLSNQGYAEAEVPVTVHSAGTAVTERIRIAGRSKVSRRVLIVGEPTSVDLNDGTVPEVEASLHQRLLH